MSSWLPPTSHHISGSIQPGLQLARQSCRQSRRRSGNRLCRCWVRRQAHFEFDFEFKAYCLVEAQLPKLSLLDRCVILSALRYAGTCVGPAAWQSCSRRSALLVGPEHLLMVAEQQCCTPSLGDARHHWFGS